ncbi:MAG TPA: T9SS type A sorting domain-containing protein [Cytophagaceae bacterium]|nr:T9SS type A sorting domain-containing protein [Cytophagaceae bacterium]
MKLTAYIIFFVLLELSMVLSCFAQQDTATVMVYNVLHYGDGCQGSDAFLHSNLKIIAEYVRPDILGMVKVESVLPPGFGDSILVNALNLFSPEKYAYCPLTNVSHNPDGDRDLLFYNQNKFGFLSVVTLLGISTNPPTEEDFNLYKLYYKDPNLSTTYDTTFLYIILNHTISGSNEIGRDEQDASIVQTLQNMFHSLPNLITMGDFNTHISSETGYVLLTQSSNSNFLFSDPPFYPDRNLNYPLDWENAPVAAKYLNTSTRQSADLPNSCGTSGGAKDWYLHLLLSQPIIKNSNYITYISNSYTTIGNDGNRTGISINDNSSFPNTSAPDSVLNAIYTFSDKYPVAIKLGITYNTKGYGPAVTVNNPVDNLITLRFPPNFSGQEMEMHLYDVLGRCQQTEFYTIEGIEETSETSLTSGVYTLTIKVGNYKYTTRIVKN